MAMRPMRIMAITVAPVVAAAVVVAPAAAVATMVAASVPPGTLVVAIMVAMAVAPVLPLGPTGRRRLGHGSIRAVQALRALLALVPVGGMCRPTLTPLPAAGRKGRVGIGWGQKVTPWGSPQLVFV